MLTSWTDHYKLHLHCSGIVDILLDSLIALKLDAAMSFAKR